MNNPAVAAVPILTADANDAPAVGRVLAQTQVRALARACDGGEWPQVGAGPSTLRLTGLGMWMCSRLALAAVAEAAGGGLVRH